MPISNPSPMERHILDLLDRIERQQQERIAPLEARMRDLEALNANLEARLETQEKGAAALADSLASFLDPSDMPPA